ncbi:ABC-2 type transport system permease protein [Pelagirhabdus alkalitolerans]|uniref:ABC-2 type transport system permease protein n=1 Tax=Pelagirhabdus alkalitolerans TaxID=1612202 RepID=A0A1G6GYG9_9BACI|nr:hypothetical protein [Pelagirhabdus alkalitolerans]SDB86725.1 ABC-2 type transport system permease protein [Pelagirhabdus alkalitolerans]
MQSKTYWFNFEVFKQLFRQVGWIGLAYTIALLLSMVFNIIMYLDVEEAEHAYIHIGSLFGFSGAVQIFLIMTIPILMAIFTSRAIHDKKANDFIHSLPMTRYQLYAHRISFGLFSLIVPLILNGVIVLIIYLTNDISHLFELSDILYWFIVTFVLLIFNFAIGQFVGMLTGTSIVQGIFSYIFIFFPVGFAMLIVFNLDYALIGLSEWHLFDEYVFNLSPMTDMASVIEQHDSYTLKLVIYFIIACVFIVLSGLLYRVRPTESANQTIAFRGLKPVFIYSFTFCFTLMGGFYFAVVQNQNNWVFIGYVIFSIIGYLIAQVVVHKTWRVFGYWKQYVKFIIGFSILVLIIVLDLTGYQNRIPEIEEIDQAFTVQGYMNHELMYEEMEGFTQEEELKRVTELHENLIDQSDRSDFHPRMNQTIIIHYQLQSGREIYREYALSTDLSAISHFNELAETNTYQKYTNRVYMYDTEDMLSLNMSKYQSDQQVVVSNVNQINQFVERYREDNLDIGEDSHLILTQIEIEVVDGDNISLKLTDQHERTLEWLEEEELLDYIRITTEDVEQIVVVEQDMYHHGFEVNYQSEDDQYIVDETDDIEMILDSIPLERSDQNYFYLIYTGDQTPIVFNIHKSDLPNDIQVHFN